MPELPQLQTVITSIKKDLANQKIIQCALFLKNTKNKELYKKYFFLTYFYLKSLVQKRG